MRDFVKGLFFGAGIGGVTGLLFAPKKGTVLQKELREYVVDSKDHFEETKADLDQVKQQVERTKHAIDHLVPQTTKAFHKDLDAFEFQLTPRIERVNEQVSTLQQHLAEAKAKFEQLN